jgi:hypothetical protein
MERSERRRSGWRVVAVLAIALFALLNTVTDTVLLWHPFADLGLSVDSSYTVIGVHPGSSADRAGVRVGDHIDMAATPAATRRFLATGVAAVPDGAHLTVALRKPNGVQLVDLRGEPHLRSAADDATNALLMLATLATVAIGTWIVLLRPSKMTWAFFLYCASSGTLAVTTGVNLPPLAAGVDLALFGAMTTASFVPFAIFALRFPADRADGWRRWAQAVLLWSLAALVPLGIYVFIGPFLGWPIEAAAFAGSTLGVAGVAFVVVTFALAFFHAPPADRAKIRWVGLGLIVGYSGPLAFNIGSSVPGIAFDWPLPVLNAVNALEIAVPISVAYVILRHRVFDVRFVLGRAAVYGAVTTIVVVGVTLLDFLVGKILSETRLAAIGEAAVAIVVGLSLNGLHKRVEGAVDALFFRGRRRAEQRLKRISEGLLHAETADAITRALVTEVSSSLQLSSCAVFRREDGWFVCDAAVGWDSTTQGIEAGAGAILALGARRAPLAIRDGVWPAGLLPAGDAAPLYAVPIASRIRLDAFVLVGPHIGGEQLDPTELELLGDLCNSAAIAYEHLDAMLAILRASSLEAENTTLRGIVTGITA